jgi:hypothetical protein
VKLTKRLQEALAEIGRYEGRNRVYWWRRASMGALAELGLVETYNPPSIEGRGYRNLPYRITPSSRDTI